MNRMPNHR